jgi:hypothetical protein
MNSCGQTLHRKQRCNCLWNGEKGPNTIVHRIFGADERAKSKLHLDGTTALPPMFGADLNIGRAIDEAVLGYGVTGLFVRSLLAVSSR